MLTKLKDREGSETKGEWEGEGWERGEGRKKRGEEEEERRRRGGGGEEVKKGQICQKLK